MARKTRNEALRTREAILDAAIEVFHARGVARSSLTDIAERIGMTRGAVYGHFRNKTEVLAAMLERNRYPWDTLASAAEQATPDDPLQALTASLTGMLEHVTREPKCLRVLTILFHRMELVGENAAMLERIHAARSEAERTIGRLLRSAVAHGQLAASLDLALAQRYLLIGLTGAMAETALEPERWAVRTDAARIVETWIAGLTSAGLAKRS
ncbi:MAG TPA: TetR family transcriptional regulator [Burkholderiaceae bacterium]|nr:TetR family transcriptional regulator [Burkholderiaceae bacterium]